jgi:RND family efflux transporter MFP subunit
LANGLDIKRVWEVWVKRFLLGLLGVIAVQAAWAQQGGPARVVVEKVTEQTVRQSTAMVGVVEFDQVSSLAAEVRGNISALNIREGQRVAKNEALATINTDFLRQQIKIKQLEVDKFDVELEKLELDLNRLQALIKTDSTSQRAYEEVLYGHAAIGKQQQIEQGNLQQLQLQLHKSTVRAPFAGVVLEVFKDVGEFIAPETPLARIASIEAVLVKVAVSEQLLVNLVPGESVVVTLDSLGIDLEGIIRGVVPVADLRTKSALLQVIIPYRDAMVENMSAKVQVPTSVPRTLRVLKRDAVISFDGKNFVYAIKDGKAAMLPVTIVSRLGDRVAVSDEEIKAGMPVVVDGNDRLRPDQDVVVVE